MADEKEEDAKLLKYRFVEEFPESIDPKTGLPYEDIDSPKFIETELWGKIEVHRIAKIKWTETEYVQIYGEMDSGGRYEEKEHKVKVYEEEMGEVGGWIEGKKNLDQAGKCWVKSGGCVVGDAFVYGDAEIGRDAEIGDFARVGGKAKVSGPVGVGDEASVLGEAVIGGEREELEADVDDKWKKGMKRKRMAVGGNATVRGDVLGTAKVYGNATVGEYARIYGKAMVYGYATVRGTKEKTASVSKEASAYGFAVVEGELKDKAVACGTAFVGSGSSIGDTVFLRNGTVFGQIIGDFGGRGLDLHVGKDSVLRFPKTDEEIATPDDLLFYHNSWYSRGISGDTALYVGEGCSLTFCSFHGQVRIEEGTNAEYSAFRSCHVTESDLYDAEVTNSRIEKADLSACALVDATTEGECRLANSTVSHGIIPKGADWDKVSFSGVTDVVEAQGVVMEGVTKKDMDSVPMAAPFQDPTYNMNLQPAKILATNRPTYGVTFWEKRSFWETWWYSWRNYFVATEGGASALMKAPNYDPSEDPPIYDPPERYNGESEALKSYDNEYSEELRKWWVANTEAGKAREKSEERAKIVRDIADPLWKESDRLEGLTKKTETINKRIFSLGHAAGWIGGVGSACHSDIDDSVWKSMLAMMKQDASASNTAVNVTSPYEMIFVTDDTMEQRSYIPDFRRPYRIPPFSDRGAGEYMYTKVNGLAASGMSEGYFWYSEYSGGNRWSQRYETMTLNALVWFIEVHDGYSWQKDQNTIENIDLEGVVREKEADDKMIENLRKSIEDKYGSVGAAPENVIRQWDNAIKSAQEKYKRSWESKTRQAEEEEIRKKNEEKEKKDAELREKYRKREKEIREARKYASRRKVAIGYVKNTFPSFTDDEQEAKELARMYRNILQTLMYGNPSSEEVENLLNEAKRIRSQYTEG